MRDGYISSSEFSQFLPPEFRLVTGDVKRINIAGPQLPSYRGLRRLTCKMVGDYRMRFLPPADVEALIRRYSAELQLPDNLADLGIKVWRLSQRPHVELPILKGRTPRLPCYECQALAALLVTLKLLIGLDDATEYKLSHIADQVNGKFANGESDSLPQLFSFTAWQKMMECRYTVLAQWHQPTRDVVEPGATTDPATTCHHLSNLPRDVRLRDRIDLHSFQLMRRRRLENSLCKLLPKLREENENGYGVDARPDFKPSLTPDSSNIESIIHHLNRTQSSRRNPPKWFALLQRDWRGDCIRHLTEPDYLRGLAEKTGATVHANDTGEWLKTHVIDTKEGGSDKFNDDQADTKFHVTLCNDLPRLKRRKFMPKIHARWIAKDENIWELRSDHTYWYHHMTGCTYESFNRRKDLPASWLWLLKVGSRLLTLPPKDIHQHVSLIEKQLFKV